MKSLASLLVENVKSLAQKGAEKSVKTFFVREKEKWSNKETDKQYVADFSNTQYNLSLSKGGKD